MGPLTDAMRAEALSEQGDIKYDITWHTLDEGLESLAHHGISPNVASFIGAATPRINVLGRANRAPTPAELDQMCAITEKAMQDGALGVASALIYQPGNYARTDELVALAKGRPAIRESTFRTSATKAIMNWMRLTNSSPLPARHKSGRKFIT